MMCVPILWVFLLFILEGFVASEHCRASESKPCVTYTFSFDTNLKNNPRHVYLDDTVIGAVKQVAGAAGARTEVAACIERPYLKHIERGTIGYISQDKIYIYNVWASGERLAEHASLEGFSNKFKLYLHEFKSLALLLLCFFGWERA
ncbi:hypothetical protein [Solidesulfovibrio sp.]